MSESGDEARSWAMNAFVDHKDRAMRGTELLRRQVVGEISAVVAIAATQPYHFVVTPGPHVSTLTTQAAELVDRLRLWRSELAAADPPDRVGVHRSFSSALAAMGDALVGALSDEFKDRQTANARVEDGASSASGGRRRRGGPRPDESQQAWHAWLSSHQETFIRAGVRIGDPLQNYVLHGGPDNAPAAVAIVNGARADGDAGAQAALTAAGAMYGAVLEAHRRARELVETFKKDLRSMASGATVTADPDRLVALTTWRMPAERQESRTLPIVPALA